MPIATNILHLPSPTQLWNLRGIIIVTIVSAYILNGSLILWKEFVALRSKFFPFRVDFFFFAEGTSSATKSKLGNH